MKKKKKKKKKRQACIQMQSRHHSSHLVIMASLPYVSNLKTSHYLSFPLEYFQAIFLLLQSLLPPLLSSADLKHFSAISLMSLSVAVENILTFFIELEYTGHAISDVKAKYFNIFYKLFYQRLPYFIQVYFKNIEKKKKNKKNKKKKKKKQIHRLLT